MVIVTSSGHAEPDREISGLLVFRKFIGILERHFAYFCHDGIPDFKFHFGDLSAVYRGVAADGQGAGGSEVYDRSGVRGGNFAADRLIPAFGILFPAGGQHCSREQEYQKLFHRPSVFYAPDGVASVLGEAALAEVRQIAVVGKSDGGSAVALHVGHPE